MKLKLDKENWNAWLDNKKLSIRTIIEYNHYLDKLDLSDVDNERILSFIQKHNNNVARAFVRNLVSHIKGSTLYNKEIKDCFASIDIPRVSGRKRKRIPDILTEEQIYLIHNAMGNERDKLLLLITFYGGLRISEIIGQYAITPYSFNWNAWLKDPEKNGTLKIIGKGNKQRVVFVPSKVMIRTYHYIKTYVSKAQAKDDKLFKIKDSRFKYILSKASNKAINRHINPHLLRHSSTTWLRDNGFSLDELKVYLGHENIATTNIYAHMSTEKLQTKFNQLTEKY